MLFKKVIIIFIILIVFQFLFSESIVLKDGNVFKGKLVFISKKNIILNVDENILDFPIITIEYLINQSIFDELSMLIIEKKNGKSERINLIKFNQKVLYYKNINKDELKFIKTSDIQHISLVNPSKINLSQKKNIYKIKNKINLNEDIDNIIEMIIKSKSNLKMIAQSKKEEMLSVSRSNVINIKGDDFYEKFWERINKYINNYTKNILWNLLEQYFDRENTLNLIYNTEIHNIYDTEELTIEDIKRREKISQDLNQKIIELRVEFYKRAKKIILNTELLIHS